MENLFRVLKNTIKVDGKVVRLSGGGAGEDEVPEQTMVLGDAAILLVKFGLKLE